jgi:hypothetical protein
VVAVVVAVLTVPTLQQEALLVDKVFLNKKMTLPDQRL